MPPRPFQALIKPTLSALALLLLLPATGAIGCSRSGAAPEEEAKVWALKPGEELALPPGQVFLAAQVRARVAGRWGRKTTLFCQDPETGRIFAWSNGRIQQEIRLPEGYAFAGVATWGKTVRNTEFFIRNVQSGRIHSCRVRTLAGVPLGGSLEKQPPKPPDSSPENLQSVPPPSPE